MFFVTGLGWNTFLIHFFNLNKTIYWISYVMINIIFISLLFIPHRIPHIINSYWMAIMFYTLMFTILALLIKLIPLGEIVTKYIDISVIGLSIIVVIVGLFIAQNIKITTYEVKIDKKQTI